MSFIPLIVIAVVLIYCFSFYNRLRRLQVLIKASVQEIGNQLKRQMMILPNAAEAVKKNKLFEKDIYQNLTDARKSTSEAISSNDAGKIDQAQQLISKAMGSIKIIVENNPELKTSEITLKYLNELTDTSDKLMYSRRTMIDLSADYNTAIATIPGAWVASLLGFKEEKGLETPLSGEHLSVSETETQSPKLDVG